MRGLNQFQKFSWQDFAQGKVFVVTGTSEYLDYESKEKLGTKVECVIAVDKTPYDFKNGNSFTNRYEKIVFKVKKDVEIPLEARVVPKDVTATIYGEYRNQLSVVCEDIDITPASATTVTK